MRSMGFLSTDSYSEMRCSVGRGPDTQRSSTTSRVSAEQRSSATAVAMICSINQQFHLSMSRRLTMGASPARCPSATVAVYLPGSVPPPTRQSTFEKG